MFESICSGFFRLSFYQFGGNRSRNNLWQHFKRIQSPSFNCNQGVQLCQGEGKNIRKLFPPSLRWETPTRFNVGQHCKILPEPFREFSQRQALRNAGVFQAFSNFAHGVNVPALTFFVNRDIFND